MALKAVVELAYSNLSGRAEEWISYENKGVMVVRLQTKFGQNTLPSSYDFQRQVLVVQGSIPRESFQYRKQCQNDIPENSGRFVRSNVEVTVRYNSGTASYFTRLNHQFVQAFVFGSCPTST
jgi:hypothetical protein